MALLMFPLALDEFFNLLPIASFRREMGENIDVAETGGGEVLAADLGPALWGGQIDLDVLSHEEASEVTPLLNLMRRSAASFLISDPTRPWPRLDPQGRHLQGSNATLLTIGASGREIAVAGLPAWYPISRGDLVSWQYGANPARYAFHEFVGHIAADQNGQTGLVEISPPLRPGSFAGTPVTLIWPHCKAKLEPGTLDTGTGTASLTSNATWRWRQTLR